MERAAIIIGLAIIEMMIMKLTILACHEGLTIRRPKNNRTYEHGTDKTSIYVYVRRTEEIHAIRCFRLLHLGKGGSTVIRLDRYYSSEVFQLFIVIKVITWKELGEEMKTASLVDKACKPN